LNPREVKQPAKEISPEERERWKDYGSALLIALTFFSGFLYSLIVNGNTNVWNKISVFIGIIGIFLTMIWFTFERTWHFKDGKPAWLKLASAALGLQLAAAMLSILGWLH